MSISIKFTLIGDGRQAEKHKQAIAAIGGEINYIYDPIKYGDSNTRILDSISNSDWVVISSPNYLHYTHIRMCLAQRADIPIIVEKPLRLPWEPHIDNDNINVVLQLRYIENLPKEASSVKVKMVRNKEYFKTWKGSERNTGGLFYHLYVHYMDLAIYLNATFEGIIVKEGKQERRIDNFDLMNIDMGKLYARMYDRIIYHNEGIKPKDIFYLNWIMNKYSILSAIRPYNKRVKIEEWL